MVEELLRKQRQKKGKEKKWIRGRGKGDGRLNREKREGQ